MNVPPAPAIEPVQLGMNTKFKFRCHKGVKCFTKCCRGVKLHLTPYDILRLKNRLGISSIEFLAIYTEPQLLEKTDLPVVLLKHLDDPLESCPFVRDDGCIIYSDRPSVCRYYPIGMASLTHKEGADDQGFYFFVREPHCKGFEEEKEWTVLEWRKDQGVDIHDEINAAWTDLLVKKRSFPQNIQLTEQSKKMFFLASYNIDLFREFVFESSFLKRYHFEQEDIEKIKENEIELLNFGIKWLHSIFFQAEKFKNVEEQAPLEKSV